MLERFLLLPTCSSAGNLQIKVLKEETSTTHWRVYVCACVSSGVHSWRTHGNPDKRLCMRKCKCDASELWHRILIRWFSVSYAFQFGPLSTSWLTPSLSRLFPEFIPSLLISPHLFSCLPSSALTAVTACDRRCFLHVTLCMCVSSSSNVTI